VKDRRKPPSAPGGPRDKREAPTAPPPRRRLSPPPFEEGRPTLTNEVELEAARLQSSMVSSPPPPNRSLTPGESSSLLNLVNAQAPTVPPPRSTATAQAAEAALESLDEPLPEPGPTNPLTDMRDRFSLGDYTGALDIAEKILTTDANNVEASTCAESCRAVLIKMYSARIGPMTKVPVVMVPRHQLRWLSIDHRAGFVLSHIDGTSSLEMILDVSGMPPLDALRILYELVQQRIISFR
jgi:hypothetical protein